MNFLVQIKENGLAAMGRHQWRMFVALRAFKRESARG